MPVFRYKAVSGNGETILGQMEGADRSAISLRLNELGHHPFDISEASPGLVNGKSGRAAKFADVTLFSRELGWLLRAGVNLSTALEMLAQEALSSRLTPVITEARAGIRKGASFHQSLADTNAFSGDYVSMIEIAEASGTLPAVLERIVETREREDKIRRRVVSATIYPALLLTLGTSAVIFILVFVVPTLKEMIVSTGGPVPEPAQFVISASDWVIANGVLAAGVVFLTLLAIIVLPIKKQLGSLALRLCLRIPIAGPIISTAAVVAFCRTLGTLLASGVSLSESLKLMRTASRDPEIGRVIEAMQTALRKGGDFLQPLATSTFFPALVSRMLRVGNETGNFTPSLLQATDMLQTKLEQRIDRALTLLEPVIILVLSTAVAFIIVSLMSAIISINDMAL